MAKYPAPVLIHRIHSEERVAVSFKTTHLQAISKVESIHLTRALSSLGIATDTVLDDGSLVVFPVVKRPGGVFPDRVNIGRTKNMDIWLPFSNISKLHAYFTIVPPGRYMLTDAGSTNGSFLSGKPLKPEQPVEILSGALLQFGQYQFLFFTPASLYGLLRAR